MKRCLLLVGFTMALGCQPAPPQASTSSNTAATADPHAGHDHGAEDLGPHGGHLLHLEPTGVHAEWTHDDESHLVTVFLDDLDAEKITAAKFVVDIPNADSEEFELTASDEGWTLSSEALMTHINMGEAAAVRLVVVDDSGEQSTKIENHEHHHH